MRSETFPLVEYERERDLFRVQYHTRYPEDFEVWLQKNCVERFDSKKRHEDKTRYTYYLLSRKAFHDMIDEWWGVR